MAVYTKISEGQLNDFLQDYALGNMRSYEGIAAGVSNTNYKLDVDGTPYVLTIFEPHRAARDDLPFFLGYAVHLKENGVTCPEMMTRRDGSYIGALAGKPAAVFSFLSGEVGSAASVFAARCGNAGKMLARMHDADKSFGKSRPNEYGPARWQDWFNRNEARMNNIREGLKEQTGKTLDIILSQWPQNLPRGTIHADYFPDNVFFDGEEVTGVIDFHFAATDFYAYDLAIALNAWTFDENNQFVPARFESFLNGYNSVRPLSKAEQAAMPVFLQAAALRFLLSRIDEFLHWPPDNLGKPHDPLVFLKRLIHFTEQGI